MQGTFGTAALAITANIGASNAQITVNNCVMTASNAVSVTGTVASGSLYVDNCIGYNDQNTTINTIANISTGTTTTLGTKARPAARTTTVRRL